MKPWHYFLSFRLQLLLTHIKIGHNDHNVPLDSGGFEKNLDYFLALQRNTYDISKLGQFQFGK